MAKFLFYKKLNTEAGTLSVVDSKGLGGSTKSFTDRFNEMLETGLDSFVVFSYCL